MIIKIEGIWATKEIFLDGKQLTPGKSLKLLDLGQVGFSWGSVSPKSKQLALAILLECTPIEVAISMYQDFEMNVLAKLPMADFVFNLNIGESGSISQYRNGKYTG